MKRHHSLYLFLLFIVSCTTFRVEDAAIKKNFATAGIPVVIEYVVTAGDTIRYIITGSDSLPTLLFVHGSPGGCNDYAWFLQDSLLRRKYRLASVDRPGFGLSEYGQAFHLQQQADMLKPTLERLHNNQPLLIAGHSYGGPLVALLAADNPDLIFGTIILAGALDPKLEKPEKWRETFLKNRFKKILPGDLYQSNAELWYLKQDLYGLQKKLKNISSQVYILHGQKDKLVPVENVAYMKNEMTGADTIITQILPKAGHVVQIFQKEEVKEFLLGINLP